VEFVGRRRQNCYWNAEDFCLKYSAKITKKISANEYHHRLPFEMKISKMFTLAVLGTEK